MENVTAREMLVMLREQIFLTTDTEKSDVLCEHFKAICSQINYLERCLDSEIDRPE